MTRVLVLNPAKMSFNVAECVELDDYYRELDCTTFDVVSRKIGDKFFDIFCDDEGLFAADPVISAINKDCEPMLVGNLIFANHDDQGNTTGLTDEDIHLICMNAFTYVMHTEKNQRTGLAVICEAF